MITYRISGPAKDALKAASRLAANHQVSGDVVVKFDDAAKVPPDYAPPAPVKVLIIVTQE